MTTHTQPGRSLTTDTHAHDGIVNHKPSIRHAHDGIVNHKRSMSGSFCHDRQGCEWDESVCTCAIYEGHLETLKWAITNRCPWDPDSCRFAASQGHLDVLKWCKANGGMLNARICINAAGSGHLEVTCFSVDLFVHSTGPWSSAGPYST